MSTYLRKEIPVLITFIVGAIIVAEYFIVNPVISDLASIIRKQSILVSAFALGLGAVSTLRFNVPKVTNRIEGEWPYSLTFLLAFALAMILGLMGGTSNDTYMYWYNALYVAPGAAMYSLLGFFIISAAYRTFIARSAEAGILLIFGAFAMLRNAPLSTSIWIGFTTIGDWILDVHTTAATRGLIMCLGLGMVALGIRIVLGLETTQIGGGK